MVDVFEDLDDEGGGGEAPAGEPPVHPVDVADVDRALASMVARLPGGAMRPQQVEMAHAVAQGITERRPTLVEAPTGVGKALDVATPIPTPSGFTAMGDLQRGDEVFDELGRPCKVTAAFSVMHGRPCFEVVFSDGSTLVADADHEWLTHDVTYRGLLTNRRGRSPLPSVVTAVRRADALLSDPGLPATLTVTEAAEMLGVSTTPVYAVARTMTPQPGPRRPGTGRARHFDSRQLLRACRARATDPARGQSTSGPRLVTTAEMRATLHRWGRRNHAVPVAGALDLPAVDLPLDPYLLGAWLGDGSTNTGLIGVHEQDREILDRIAASGHVLRTRRREDGFLRARIDPGVARWEGWDGFSGALGRLGVRGDKHIPDSYLRASFDQRLALLQGLMDTDGYASPSGCEFTVVNERLFEGVRHLTATLGIRSVARTAATSYRTASGRRVRPGTTAYTLRFTTDLPVFSLTRKLQAQQQACRDMTRSRTRYRYVVDVRPVESRPVRCIQVSSDSHLYLAGHQCIPTHNSMAYLVPAALASGSEPVVVATATKTLQQQLVDSDLPALAEQFPGLSYAILKGRSNYLCLDKLADAEQGQATFSFRAEEDEQAALLEWAAETPTGDEAELPDGVSHRLFREFTVSPRECTSTKCAFYEECFAERARARAFGSDVVVTNVHMLLLDATIGVDSLDPEEDPFTGDDERPAGGYVLPRHRVAIVDEAHKLPDVASRVLGTELSSGRLRAAATTIAPMVEDATVEALQTDAAMLDEHFDAWAGQGDGRLELGDESWAGVLRQVAGHVAAARSEVDAHDTDDERGRARRDRARLALSSLALDVAALAESTEGTVVWVEPSSGRRRPSMTSAPVDVAPLLRRLLFDTRTVVATSATLAVGGTFDHVSHQFGLDTGHRPLTLKVGSPFDHAANSLLYVPKEWPDPRHRDWPELFRERTLQFVLAAGGRAMLLHTSYRNLHETVEWIRPHLEEAGIPLHVQGEAPTGRLIERMRAEETSVLAGTTSFWEGVDVPGSALGLVVIDKLPFPRRGDPLLDARREAAEAVGRSGFEDVDVPHTATLLAQGAGRLLRRVDDVGVVAVMDSRLATKGYRRPILATLPPFRRTIDVAEVETFLRERLRGA